MEPNLFSATQSRQADSFLYHHVRVNELFSGALTSQNACLKEVERDRESVRVRDREKNCDNSAFFIIM